MSNNKSETLFKRLPLDKILKYPQDIISVYSVEEHIWQDKGSQESKQNRIPESRTVEEFLIDPVRSFLNDALKLMAAPYQPDRRDLTTGQGYWIQADFGSGKSHLLSFLGALALGDDDIWEIVKKKEDAAGLGKRESIHNFYENGLKRKNETTKGILVAVKTLVGRGSGAVGLENADKTLTDLILESVSEQFFIETGKPLLVYPSQILVQRFLESDIELYSEKLRKYLKDPKFFDEEEQEELSDFINDLNNPSNPETLRDCGQKLWNFYNDYLKVKPNIPLDTEDVLENMVKEVLAGGFAGLLLILDEVSLFMRERDAQQRAQDEEALVVMSNRLTRVRNYPVWTVCAAQQAIESKSAGSKNIIARERLDLVPLLKKETDYYTIALSRVREIINEKAIDQYYEDYKRGFTWLSAQGKDQFSTFFPFYKNSMDVLRAVSSNLTTMRSSLYFMLETLKRQANNHSNELITLWSMFDEVVTYSEDPSGVNRSIANIQTKFPVEWAAYEEAKRQMASATKGYMQVYYNRCEKIVKTLFLEYIARTAEKGLTAEEIMNAVMEWKDHNEGQQADIRDNLDHYEILLDTLARELIQVEKSGTHYRFNPAGGSGILPKEIFDKYREEATNNEVDRKNAWRFLLTMDEWPVRTAALTFDLSMGVKSVFAGLGEDANLTLTIDWHKRAIKGRLLLRDLRHIPHGVLSLPNINTESTGEDFMVIISSSADDENAGSILSQKDDPRLIIWVPDILTQVENDQLIDFTAYNLMIAEYRNKDDDDAQKVIQWVANHLEAEMGPLQRMVSEVYGRGLLRSLNHQQLSFTMQGDLTTILTPAVGLVLDSTYDSHRMAFNARNLFDDTAVMNVINGIVKMGQFERGIRPSKEVDASRAFAPTLELVRPGNPNQLVLTDCTYARDLLKWIEEKSSELGTAINLETLVKNFTGINGPNQKNYGLSKRLIQMYILALVRDGKLRVQLSGRSAPVDVLDYANIESVNFTSAVLDSIQSVEVLEPPEGWEVIAPFAAILMKDEALRTAMDEEDIQQGVRQLIEQHQSLGETLPQRFDALIQLFEEIGQENSFAETITQWRTFLTQNIDRTDAIKSIAYAFEQGFDYPLYSEGEYSQADLDDFSTRFTSLSQIETLLAKAEILRSIAAYTRVDLPDAARFNQIRQNLTVAASGLGNLQALTAQPARLEAECLRPGQEAIGAYTTHYLTAFDQVVKATEEARETGQNLMQGESWKLLEALEANLPQLASGQQERLKALWKTASEKDLFQTDLTRAEVARELSRAPRPRNCTLSLDNAETFIRIARDYSKTCLKTLEAALAEKAALLVNPVFRARLAEGDNDAGIKALLEAKDEQDVIAVLEEMQQKDDFTEWLHKLAQLLRKVAVVKLRLDDFQPSKGRYQASQMADLVEEFKSYLQQAVESAEAADDILIEIDDQDG